MGEHSGVEWTDKSHGFWFGCEKVSQGCKHCYAERDMQGYGKNFHTVTRAKGFDKPLSWKEPCKVFVTPWSDFFIEAADAWRAEAWDIIRRTPHLTYQILTKRPEFIAGRLPPDWGAGYPNVWLGVSIESQQYWERLVHLSYIPCVVRFVSAEPLIGPLDFRTPRYYKAILLDMVDWIIVGGESGPDARPMDPCWAQSLMDQFAFTHTARFFKQMGGAKRINGHWGGNELYGHTYQEFPRIETATMGQLELPLD